MSAAEATAIIFEWKPQDTRSGQYHATVTHEGIRLFVQAVGHGLHLSDPCFPADCSAPGVPLVRVAAHAYAPDNTELADAVGVIHARLVRPASCGTPWHEERPGDVPGGRRIADCAADQATDAVRDARAALQGLVNFAARIGITAAPGGKEG